MDQTEFEIEIRPNGEVKVHVKGVQGRQCLAYADLLAEITERSAPIPIYRRPDGSLTNW